MTGNDRDYFRKRAATERTMAVTAASPVAAAVHNQLAERYEALAGDRPTLQLVEERAA
jgi:hypothetical protein